MSKWVLVSTVTFGAIKKSCRAGTIIDYDEKEHSLTINGEKFTNDNDFVAVRALEKKLNKPFLVPFSEKALEEARNATPVLAKEKDELNPREKMPIVKSDEDNHEEININYTKMTKPEAVDKSKPMNIVKGEEEVKERIERLQREVPKMEIVKDDSSFDGSGKGQSLNKEQVKTLDQNQKILVEQKRQEILKENCLPKDTEVIFTPKSLAKVPDFVEPVTAEEIKRGPGRPKKAVQVGKE